MKLRNIIQISQKKVTDILEKFGAKKIHESGHGRDRGLRFNQDTIEKTRTKLCKD